MDSCLRGNDGVLGFSGEFIRASQKFQQSDMFIIGYLLISKGRLKNGLQTAFYRQRI